MSSFADNFWGEKNNGFSVLYHNMKEGQVSCKEFTDFLRESCMVEENYAKLLGKLSRMASNFGQVGTFAPYWAVIKTLADKLHSLHMQLAYTWQDLIRDMHKYSDEQQKKHKSVKDSEAPTSETVSAIQQTTSALQKAKDTYHNRCMEYEKLKRDSNSSQKDLEKAEAKYKKSLDDYKTLTEKYANIRNEFETKMTSSCQRFEEVETHHLLQMKDFVNTYASAWRNQYVLLGKVHEEYEAYSESLTVDSLLNTFIQNKQTGSEKPAIRSVSPGPIEFEEADTSKLTSPITNGDENKEIPMLEKPKTGGFIMKGRKDKKKEKKKKKAKDKEDEKDEKKSEEPQVDEEGYTIRPDNPQGHEDQASWSYSSDSDSDSDDKRRKIHVAIKPISPNDGGAIAAAGNADDIKLTMQGIKLASPNVSRRENGEAGLKKSQSVTDSLGSSTSQDLLGLFDTLAPNTAPAPLAPALPLGPALPMAPPPLAASPADSSEDTPSSSPVPTVTSRARASTPTNVAPLLGPPPVKGNHSAGTARPGGRHSPGTMGRTDSTSSLAGGFGGASTVFGVSRGPSPLTVGADSIPIAIALSETLNALYQGADESSCKVKLTGDVTISFHVGILRVLSENLSSNPLCFKLRNDACLDNTVVNKDLVTMETQGPENTYSFDMNALNAHLRKQHDANPHASFFNIDILKYRVRDEKARSSLPLHMQAHWRRETATTDFRLDYRLQSSRLPPSAKLTKVAIAVPVDGDVTKMQSVPNAKWCGEENRARWTLPELSADGVSSGTVKARFELKAGPSSPATSDVTFHCDGGTLSGLDFDLRGPGFRLSLLKRCFKAGRIMVDQEPSVQYVS